MAGHIAHLVVPAALHEARAPEDLADRLAQRFGPVEDEQPRPPGVQAALDEALEQPQRDDGVLARALPDAQDPLVALVVHTERREDVVAAELDAVKVDDQIVPVVEPSLRQFRNCSAKPWKNGRADCFGGGLATPSGM